MINIQTFFKYHDIVMSSTSSIIIAILFTGSLFSNCCFCMHNICRLASYKYFTDIVSKVKILLSRVVFARGDTSWSLNFEVWH